MYLCLQECDYSLRVQHNIFITKFYWTDRYEKLQNTLYVLIGIILYSRIILYAQKNIWATYSNKNQLIKFVAKRTSTTYYYWEIKVMKKQKKKLMKLWRKEIRNKILKTETKINKRKLFAVYELFLCYLKPGIFLFFWSLYFLVQWW